MFSCVIKIQKTDCAAIDYKKKEKRRELKNENNQTTVREVDRIETEEIQITHPAIILIISWYTT